MVTHERERLMVYVSPVNTQNLAIHRLNLRHVVSGIYSWNRKIVYPPFLAIFEKIGQFFVIRFFASFFENHVHMAVYAVKTEVWKHFSALLSTTN